MSGAEGSSSGPNAIVAPSAVAPKWESVKNFFKEYWGNILTFVLSTVVAGTIGFFSGIWAVKEDIARLGERVAVSETEITSNIKPKLLIIDQQSDQVRTIKGDLDFLRRQNDIAIQTNALLDLRLVQEQEKTLKALENILNRLVQPKR